jgi:uncharacterized membrane protein YkvA (DUF1232 family)
MKMPLPGRVNLFRRAIAHMRLATRLFREPQVPLIFKALLIGAAGYVVLPFDLLPDFIPGLGQLDDLTVMVLAIESVIALVPSRLVEHHLNGILDGRPFVPVAAGAGLSGAGPGAAAAPGAGGPVIDAEWRRH